jgi:peptide/nickel transport system permease protein
MEEPAAAPPWGGAAAEILRFLLQRIVPALITLWLISVVVFASTHVLGINVALRVLGRQATPEQLAEFNRAHGLDRPVYEQYGVWLWDFVRGDWGTSAVSDRSITEMVVPRLQYTMILAVAAIVIALPLSIAFGIYLARPGSRARELVLSISNVSLAAIPVFVIGIVLIYLFSVQLGWTPVDSSGLAFGSWSDKAAAFILPTATLVITLLPHISRLTQVSVRETMTTPYARAAVLRGLSRRTITYRHLMPNAAGPIVNVVALDLIWLIGGVIIVENVFGFPGLGSLLVQSIAAGDLLVVQAVAMVSGVLFIGIGVAADILVTVFNPRLRNG